MSVLFLPYSVLEVDLPSLTLSTWNGFKEIQISDPDSISGETLPLDEGPRNRKDQ
jgi:hypothetical protein